MLSPCVHGRPPTGCTAVERRARRDRCLIDADTGFLQVLTKRLDRARLAAPRARQPGPARQPRRDAPQRRSWSTSRSSGRRAGTTWRALLRACRGWASSSAPGLDRRAARPRPAAGRRRLGDEAVPSGGADRPRRGGRAAAQARRGAGDAGPVAVGEVEIRAGPVPGLRRRRSRRPHAPRVRADPAARRGRGPGAAARGDLPARLGLRDGPRRPVGRRLRAQAAPEARAGVARAGATSTRTSASATGSRPSPRSGAPAEAGGRRSPAPRRPPASCRLRAPAPSLGGRRRSPRAPERAPAAIVRAVGPDRNKHLRNIAIILAARRRRLAAARAAAPRA